MSRARTLPELSDLSPEQRAVVESEGQGLAVMAGAGSGKTTTLVIKCEYLLTRNPEARLAAVSFTEKSASDLRAKLTERFEAKGIGDRADGVLSRHWVMTIHGLCAAILREYPKEAGFDGEEQMLSEGETQALWLRAIESLWFELELPAATASALDRMLAREKRTSLEKLIRRLGDLGAQGATARLRASAVEDERALAEVGAYVLERYERLKQRRGALDFADLERGADRALDHAHVRADYRRRFDLVLVDEFQDTNPLQARILDRLVREDFSNLCVVGDPKQSIYRFRDADVSVFQEFCAKLPVNLSLTWNFRSRPGIIEYTNGVCGRAFPSGGMAYEALVPKREVDPDLAPVLRLNLQSPEDLAVWVRTERDRGVKLEDMALLLRKIRGNERWLKALTVAGVPIAVGSGGLLWSDPRAREIVFFLKWWDDPAHSFSGAVFLRAPWVGISDEELDVWVKLDPTLRRPFLESGHPIAHALLARMARGPLRPAQALEALLEGPQAESEIGAPWLGLWHRCEELSSRGFDFHSVVTELFQAMHDERRERDVPPPRNQGQLGVLTLHGSKGLEFPHVILLDFGKKGRAAEAPLLFWDRARGVFLGKRDADGERLRDEADEALWREDERRKSLAESQRLFYVALTRARERLILVCPALEPSKKSAPAAEDPFESDDWRAWIDHAGGEVAQVDVGGLGEGLESLPPSVAPPAEAPTIRPEVKWMRPRHSVTEWNLLSRCERAYEWRYVRPVVPDQPEFGESPEFLQLNDERITPASGLSPRELGTRVHRALELGDEAGLRALETEAGRARLDAESIIEWAKERGIVRGNSGGHGLVAGTATWSELDFEAPIGTEVLVGSIDRVEEQGGRLRVIDFKIVAKRKSEDELLEAYSTQMALYETGLRSLGVREPIESELVAFSPQGVQVVPVPTAPAGLAEALALRASEIVAGREGIPILNSLCRFCEFREKCPEGERRAALS